MPPSKKAEKLGVPSLRATQIGKEQLILWWSGHQPPHTVLDLCVRSEGLQFRPNPESIKGTGGSVLYSFAHRFTHSYQGGFVVVVVVLEIAIHIYNLRISFYRSMVDTPPGRLMRAPC